MLSKAENLRRVVRFERPEYIPMAYCINGACWHHYPNDALHELLATHPFLFPGFKPERKKAKPAAQGQAQACRPYTDRWGCVLETTDEGIMGVVTHHPLERWDTFDQYRAPDPDGHFGSPPVDWKKLAADMRQVKAQGGMPSGSLPHGHTFLRLQDLRGYANLLYDMTDAEPRVFQLIQRVEDYNMAIVQRYLELGVEMMSYPEDLGMQVGPMLSPAYLRKYVKPSYQRLMAPARARGVIVHMHSDGDIRDLVGDLIDGGVEIINLQDLVNGIDWIAARLAGKYCIELDIDRQQITRFGTPKQVDALIREEVRKIGRPEGGLMMIYGMYPGIPLKNARALMDAMEKYAFYYA